MKRIRDLAAVLALNTETSERYVVLALTHAEIELLYDGLDASYDRLSHWHEEPFPEEDTDFEALDHDMQEVHKLSMELSPTIAEIRQQPQQTPSMIERAREHLHNLVNSYIDSCKEMEDSDTLTQLDEQARVLNFCDSTIDNLRGQQPQQERSQPNGYISVRKVLERAGVQTIADYQILVPPSLDHWSIYVSIRETFYSTWRTFRIKFKDLEVEEVTRHEET